MTALTIGTHNLHDRAGRPTPFADLVLFTEADRGRLRVFDQLRGYGFLVCERQPSLAIAYRRRLFEPEHLEYRLAHVGREKVTPNRGTWAVDGILAGRDTTLLLEHRINAAFWPYGRGEVDFRRKCWETHTTMTLRWVKELDQAGRLVIGGGDTNTPHNRTAYRGWLDEVGNGADRLGVTHKGTRLHRPEYLDGMGSDHRRLRAELVI